MAPVYSIVAYSTDEIQHAESNSLAEVLAQVKSDQVTWLTMSGITLIDDHAAVQTALDHFHLNARLLDAIFKPNQDQFEDDFDDCVFLEYAILLYRPSRRAYARVRGNIILGSHFLLLIEKTPAGLFEKTRRRILGKHTNAQEHGADYLLFLLVKTFVINYQRILKSLAEKLEALEDEVISHPGRDYVYDRILELREEFKPLYSYITELIEFIGDVSDDESYLISKDTKTSFTKSLDRDAKDLLASYQHMRAWIAEVIEIHRANVNESTNRVMKTLTIISTIFLPLTFIAGVYGMNFDQMPELHWEWGYPVVLLFMFLLAVGALVFMRIKKWL